MIHHHNHKASAKPRSFMYNPFELAFCGQAGSSRSTLVSRLVRNALQGYVVGHVDNDVPYQSQEAEQTFLYCENTRFQHVLVHPTKKDEYVKPWPFLDADMVFVEDGRDSELPKLVMLDDLRKSRFSNVIGYVGRGVSCAGQASGAPQFERDNLEAIRDFILDYFQERARERPLYGLVLAGGRSTRMNADKTALQYHGKPQVRHCYDLLAAHCTKVFVSTRSAQAESMVLADLPQIPDQFVDIGPMGGILSALKAHPDAAWLVLACDLPFMDHAMLERLVRRRNPFKLATAYMSRQGSLPEPLCAIYEPKSIFRLLHFLALGYQCPRKVLVNSDTHLLEPGNPIALTNVNEPKEYEEALAHIRGHRKAAP